MPTLNTLLQIPPVADTFAGEHRKTLRQSKGTPASSSTMNYPPNTFAYDTQAETFLRARALSNTAHSSSLKTWIDGIAQGVSIDPIISEIQKTPELIIQTDAAGLTIVDALIQFIGNSLPFWESSHTTPYDTEEITAAISTLNHCFAQDFLWGPTHNNHTYRWALAVESLPPSINEKIELSFLIRVFRGSHFQSNPIHIQDPIELDPAFIQPLPSIHTRSSSPDQPSLLTEYNIDHTISGEITFNPHFDDTHSDASDLERENLEWPLLPNEFYPIN